MSKKNIGLVLLLIGLGAIYVFNFTNFFREPKIEITTRIRPQPARRSRGNTPTPPAGNSIAFFLNGKYQLTSVKVIEENDFKTNKYPHALWHLISESNSVPTKAVYYGQKVDGMKPDIDKTKAEPLQSKVPYVLFVEAGDLKGQTVFHIP